MIQFRNLFLIFVFLLSSTLVASPDFSQPQTHLHFADSLADEGDYYRAITEYKRVLFYFPDYQKQNWVKFQIGRMYYEGGRYSAAKEYLIPLTADDDLLLRYYSLNWLSLTYFENAEYVNSSRLFRELASDAKDSEVNDDYMLYAAVSEMRDKRFYKANEIFSSLKREGQKEDVLKFVKDAEELSLQAAERGKKNRFLATSLGIIFPGSGHLYLHQWDNFSVILTVVGLTGYLAVDGYLRGNATQGILFSTFASGFYAGSIYSAYSETKKYNQRLGDEEIKSVNKKFDQLTIGFSTPVSY